jgi:tetrahydromethanopterin S-methyltransferase subunit D
MIGVLMNNPTEQVQTPTNPSEKLPTLVAIACFWPVILVAFGGLVGGLLGGVAGAVNLGLYRSSVPRWALWMLNPLVGIIAIILWLVIAVLLELALNGSQAT